MLIVNTITTIIMMVLNWYTPLLCLVLVSTLIYQTMGREYYYLVRYIKWIYLITRLPITTWTNFERWRLTYFKWRDFKLSMATTITIVIIMMMILIRFIKWFKHMTILMVTTTMKPLIPTTTWNGRWRSIELIIRLKVIGIFHGGE